MLVLTRKVGETVVIDGGIEVTITAIDGNRARLGVSAPPDTRIDREEVHRRIVQWAGPGVARASVETRAERTATAQPARQPPHRRRLRAGGSRRRAGA
jgi:carbon storage regulator